jgi:hypothetical protein
MHDPLNDQVVGGPNDGAPTPAPLYAIVAITVFCAAVAVVCFVAFVALLHADAGEHPVTIAAAVAVGLIGALAGIVAVGVPVQQYGFRRATRSKD